ncbi:MAG: hypothetical protein H0V53_00500 [Rubrobacter sp.]|jgi:hypothetical protein|nr:hypothetical protein [Rubrobacter sp.]
MEGRDPAEVGGRHRDSLLYSRARWERWLLVATIAVASIGLGYLFFTQIWWKTPPTFGCPESFAFTGEGDEGQLVRTGGLCDWIGLGSFYADQPETMGNANIIRADPGPETSVPVGGLKSAYAAYIDNFIEPNIRWFGYMIWGGEAFIFLSLSLGFFSRLGAFTAVVISAHLTLGLAGIPNPSEWEWSYLLIVLLATAMFGIAPGRYFGLDRLLRPRFKLLSDRGSRVARLLHALT